MPESESSDEDLEMLDAELAAREERTKQAKKKARPSANGKRPSKESIPSNGIVGSVAGDPTTNSSSAPPRRRGASNGSGSVGAPPRNEGLSVPAVVAPPARPPVALPTDRLAELHNQAAAVAELIDESKENAEYRDEAKRVVLSMARTFSSICEQYTVDVACMQTALDEELYDLRSHHVRLLEHQQQLDRNGLVDDAEMLRRATQSVANVEASLALLHLHPSHAATRQATVDPEGMAVAMASR